MRNLFVLCSILCTFSIPACVENSPEDSALAKQNQAEELIDGALYFKDKHNHCFVCFDCFIGRINRSFVSIPCDDK